VTARSIKRGEDKEMNCRRVEKLIPLYVEGDLASGLAQRLTSHLEWCGRCNWLADDYRESQTWLRANEPPVYDEAFLDNFKSGILQRIEQAGARPSLLASFLHQWSRRQVLALSAALLIIFGALVFYIYRVKLRDTSAPREMIVQRDEVAPPSNKRQQATNAGMAAGAGWSEDGRRKRDIKVRNVSPTVKGKQADAPLVSKKSRPEESWSVSDEPSTGLDLPEMLRIEIQTADPNIRIIWFAPKEVEHPLTIQ